jgi:bifunctional isochorismate lyase/aryl carrier protein
MRDGFRLTRARATLIVVDMQDYFLNEASAACVPGAHDLIVRINQLIGLFGEADRPIVFTRHCDRADGLMVRWWRQTIREHDPLSRLAAELDTKRGEVIIKDQYDAFLHTDLEAMLKQYRVEQLVITGVLTNLCCESTARAAFMRGFEVYFVSDATGTYDRKMHEATLLNLAYGFAMLTTVDEVKKIF